MKKRLSLLLCAALILMITAGCGQEAVEATETPTQLPTEPSVVEMPIELAEEQLPYEGVKLQYWSQLHEQTPEARALRQAADYYYKATGALVEFNWLGADTEALRSALTGDLQADLFEAAPEVLQEGLLDFALDLTEMAEAAGYADHSYAALRDQVVRRFGYLAGIPQTVYVYGMYYDQDAFGASGILETPDSWEDFLKACRKLEANGFEPLSMDLEKTGLVLELHMERTLGNDRLEQLVSGGGWEKDEQVVASVQRIVDLVAAGYMVRGTPAEYPAGQNKLALSNAAMVVGSNELCAEVEEATLMELSWGVFPYPGDGAGTGVLVDSDLLAVNRSTVNAQAAFDFAMLVTCGDFDQLRADLSGGIPADPNNVSSISGAREALLRAAGYAPGKIDPKYYETYSRVWTGYYTKSAYYASTLNILAKKS